MEKLIYTWQEQISDTNKICNQIEKDEFIPDVIVGISRGWINSRCYDFSQIKCSI
jgi:hypoxanthine phosphoribosyltransferase